MEEVEHGQNTALSCGVRRCSRRFITTEQVVDFSVTFANVTFNKKNKANA